MLTQKKRNIKLSCANTYPLDLGPSVVKQLRKTKLKQMKAMDKINLSIFNYFHSKQGNVLISNDLGISYKGQCLSKTRKHSYLRQEI